MIECYAGECEQEATYRVDGWVEDGWDGAYAYSFFCERHTDECREWAHGAWLSEPFGDFYWHGFAYITGIRRLEKEEDG